MHARLALLEEVEVVPLAFAHPHRQEAPAATLQEPLRLSLENHGNKNSRLRCGREDVSRDTAFRVYPHKPARLSVSISMEKLPVLPRSKAFTKETDDAPEDDFVSLPPWASLPPGTRKGSGFSGG